MTGLTIAISGLILSTTWLLITKRSHNTTVPLAGVTAVTMMVLGWLGVLFGAAPWSLMVVVIGGVLLATLAERARHVTLISGRTGTGLSAEDSA